jgi:DNA polymerase-3 subunit epsilon
MLFDQPCAIVDLETTGGHITRDRITEIGIVLVDGDRVERFSSLINPGQPIPPFIEKMTGISNEMVADAPPFEALADEILAMLSGRLFIAHNARFDYGFLKNAFRRLGLKFQTEVLCSVKLSRKLYPQHYKHNLDSLIERHGIVLEERHRAMADAEAVWAFLQSARAELTETVIEEMAGALLARPQIPDGLDADVVDSLPDVPGVFLFYDADDTPLLVGRTGNLRSGVLGYFSGEHRPGKDVRLADQVKRIEWQETVGEFGAMLLEVQLIKALRPHHNVKGRGVQEVCSVHLELSDDGYLQPRIVSPEEMDFSHTGDLFGLFRSSREAKRMLADLANAHSLCQVALGLENGGRRKGRPCAAWPLGRCRGACVGREPANNHNARLLMALSRLRVQSWPFPGPVALVEVDEVSGETAEHIFDGWCYLGSKRGDEEDEVAEPVFDIDTYKLLAAAIKKPPANTSLRLLDKG